MDIEDLSKDELIALLKQFHEKTDETEKPYHPDSLMALSLASPEEARAISMRMMPLASKIALGIGFSIIFLGGLLVLIIGLSV